MTPDEAQVVARALVALETEAVRAGRPVPGPALERAWSILARYASGVMLGRAANDGEAARGELASVTLFRRR